MADLELRTCRRTGCRWPASASLSYRYDTRQVWLVDLVDEAHPSLYDLCPHHADALTVPRGWERVDQRTEREAQRELSAHERANAAPPAPVENRYAALSADLPRLAEEVARREDGAVATRPPRPPIPSRDLAPVPVEERGAPVPTGDRGEVESAATDEVHDGQLAIPVDDPTTVDDGAVVVSIELAGGRRRSPSHS